MTKTENENFRHPESETGEVLELKNGRFVDVVGGCYLPADVRMIVQDGRIVSMPGIAGLNRKIRSTVSFDLKGKAVIPGLFNTHCHLQITHPSLVPGLNDLRTIKNDGPFQVQKTLADCLRRGITTIRDARTDYVDSNRALKERIRRGEIAGPRIYQSILVSQLGGAYAPRKTRLNQFVHTLLGLPTIAYDAESYGTIVFPPQADEMSVRAAVDRAIDERKADYIKFYEQREKMVFLQPGATIMSFEQLTAAVDQARCRKVKTTMHCLSLQCFRRAVRAGVSSIVHLPIDGVLEDEDIDEVKRAGCIIEPTVTLAYSNCWSFKGREDRRDGFMTTRLNAYRNATYKNIIEHYWCGQFRKSALHGFEMARRGRFRLFGILDISRVVGYYAGYGSYGMENLAQLYNNGAVLACGNDAGVPPITPAMIEIEFALMDLGLNGDLGKKKFRGADALKIATIHSARAMGLDAELGSFDTGKIADFAVVDGDPLEDYRIIGSPVAALFMNGKLAVNNCGLAPRRVH